MEKITDKYTIDEIKFNCLGREVFTIEECVKLINQAYQEGFKDGVEMSLRLEDELQESLANDK